MKKVLGILVSAMMICGLLNVVYAAAGGPVSPVLELSLAELPEYGVCAQPLSFANRVSVDPAHRYLYIQASEKIKIGLAVDRTILFSLDMSVWPQVGGSMDDVFCLDADFYGIQRGVLYTLQCTAAKQGQTARDIKIKIWSGAEADGSATVYPQPSERANFEKLDSLKIMTGDREGYRPFAFITRAEMAAVAARAIGIFNPEPGTNRFSDVPAGHWASGYIDRAVLAGILSGYEDGTFRPEADVTGAQAIKMLVCALGYTASAERLGYPAGYIKTAKDLGITKGLSINSDKPLRRFEAAALFSHGLLCPIMMEVSFNPSQYLICDGTNGAMMQTMETYYHSDSVFVLLDKDNQIILSDADLVSAETGAESEKDYRYIELRMNEKAKEKFAAATEQIAAYAEGQNVLQYVHQGQVLSKPRVIQKIDAGVLRLTGEFDRTKAEQIVQEINDGIKKHTTTA